MNSIEGTPLTYAQESIYFLSGLTNGRPVYHMPQAFRVEGRLDADALGRALGAVVGRHEALRTAIFPSPDGPRQVVRPPAFPLGTHQTRPEDLPARLADAIAEPFDLAGGQPFRADLFRLGAEEHVLLLNLHHALGDMASLGIIFRELSAAYSGRPLPENPGQNSAYAAARRTTEPAAGTREFWQANLADFTGDLELPLDRPRPRYPSFAGGAVYREFPEELTARLKQLARGRRCSVYMVCLAALQALVRRYSGQERFCIATPFSDRDDPAFEHTVGYLVNLLPVPCQVKTDESFEALLKKVREACLDAYANSGISFRQILKGLNLAGDNPKPALARVVFQYFPELPELHLPGMRCTPVRVHSRTSKFDLCFSLFEREGGIVAELEYDSDLFTPETAAGWAHHYETLLRSATQLPGGAVGRLNIIPPGERARIAGWNETRSEYPRDRTVHGLFEEQAVKTPDATAIVSEAGRLTYRELDKRANAIAAELHGKGVRPGDRVGVCLPRSTGLIAALLGILKTGAAFVPFDAGYPRARLDYLFKDSDVRLLVTDPDNARSAPAGIELVFPPSSRAPSFAAQGTAEGAAYVMYTSGSTGDPKGVVVPHRAVARLVKNNDFCSFGPEETWLAFAPVSFDASTLEIWAPLLNGGTLAVYPAEFQSVAQFETVLREFGVTSLWLAAGLFNTIVDQNAGALRGVRQLLVGGDVLSPAHVRKALDALPGTRLINGYGPTENTTFTCCYRIPSDFPPDRPIPIGRPIRNTEAYILDEFFEPVPPGVPGELCAAGDGLALGYLNQPELTAAAFVVHHGQRLYRTGDRARYLPDGNIEFLGRRDSQVKIRGFRVELGEVETALRQADGIRDAAVVALPDSAGGKHLVAYVTPAPGVELDLAAVQERLRASLPDHACPPAIVPLPELPLGPNGKVNKAALPKPGGIGGDASGAAPESEVQIRLAEIWRKILEVPGVGLDDNFFHRGGESLRATRAISQINRAFNCKLTLPRLFEAPTVRQMARVVETSRAASEAPIREAGAAESGSLPIAVGNLSDEEVNALLNQLIADEPSKSAESSVSL